MKIEIVKPYRLLQVGAVLNIDREYCKKLISKGFAKSLEAPEATEVVEVAEVAEVAEEVEALEVAGEKKSKKK
jgi:hypothetical protein